MYRLDFTRDSAGVEPTQPDKRYSICIQSILTAQRPAGFDVWDDVIGLLKKLKSLGNEKNVGPQRTYELKDGGGIIELERAEKAQLQEFIKSGAWIPEWLEDVRNTYKWVEGQQEVKIPEDTVSGPRMEGRRART